MIDDDAIRAFVGEARVHTQNSANERQLSQALEACLERVCVPAGAAWSPYSLETPLKTDDGRRRFADVVHGAVIIEYEPPGSFGGRAGRNLNRARRQAEEYGRLLSASEGRPANHYQLVVWDGETICFGADAGGGTGRWDSPASFDGAQAMRLVRSIVDNGRPLVGEAVLAQSAGPASEVGGKLIPLFYKAVSGSTNGEAATRTRLLFAEWKRLFGQAVGMGDGDLGKHVDAQSAAHGVDYRKDLPAYLFALNTYIALLAKLTAAKSLDMAAEDIADSGAPVRDRIRALEDGSLFSQAGIANMITGDFFRWYADDDAWPGFESPVNELLNRLGQMDFDVTKKSAQATRDLFKGIYESCVPRELRQALGEFYTPDWLAERGMDILGWDPKDDLLDPTCGSGTFLLAALKRRMDAARAADEAVRPEEMLSGLWGTDLNPLAVLVTKASLAVFLSPYVAPRSKIRLPVFLSDAVNPTVSDDGYYEHELLTEKGLKRFSLPEAFVESDRFYQAMTEVQALVDDGESPPAIVRALKEGFSSPAVSEEGWMAIKATVDAIAELHDMDWNGVWCSILADRFAAGAIKEVSHICGNPPWVKWSRLPPEYAKFMKRRCRSLGVFSDDAWVGGIESDISTVIAHEAVDRYLKDGGRLGFFITGTVFANESSEGFRKFRLRDGSVVCGIEGVEDYKELKPFDGVSNHPVFFTVKRGSETSYPVKYLRWRKTNGKKVASLQDLRDNARAETLRAELVPGGPAGGNRPWLIGTAAELRSFRKVFRSRGAGHAARKGVTTDRNGVFWVRVLSVGPSHAMVENLASMGRSKGIPVRKAEVEKEHVFPLLRGKDLSAFKAVPSLHILVPQRGMHGDPELRKTAPDAYGFLRRFKTALESRSSFRRYQRGRPWYSLWSTGEYTFKPHKVAWKEMSGGKFCADYVGRVKDRELGAVKAIVPDHKLYFLVAETAAEAHFITGFLNSTIVRKAVNAYASSLSLGASVAEYVGIPEYDPSNKDHRALSGLARSLRAKAVITPRDEEEVDALAARCL